MSEGVSTAAAQLAGSQLLVNGATTLLTWVLLRFAAPTDIALIPLVTLIGGFFGVVLRLGTGTQLIRELPRLIETPTPGKCVEDVAGAVLRASVIGTLLAVPATVVAWWWLAAGKMAGQDSSLIAAMLFTAVVIGLSQNSPIWLQAGRRYRLLAIANSVSSLVEQVLMVGLFLALGPVGILIGIVVGRLVLMGFAGYMINGFGLDMSLVVQRALHPSQWMTHGQHSLALNSVMRFLLVRSDTIVIAALLPAKDLALYWVAYKLIAYIFLVAQSVFKPVVTEMAAVFEDPVRLRELHRTTWFSATVVFAGLAGAVAAVAPWFMRYYGGPKYADGAGVMVVLALYGFAYAVYSVPQSVVLASHDARRLLHLETLVGLVALGASALGAVTGGVIGVAFGQLTGMVVGYVLASRVSKRFVPSDGETRGLLACVAAAVACFVWVWLPGIRTELVLAPLVTAACSVLYLLVQARVLSRDSVAYWSLAMPPITRRLVRAVSADG